MELQSNASSRRPSLSMTTLVLASILLTQQLKAEGLPAEVTTNTGVAASGELIALTESGVELKQSGKTVQFNAADLMTMEMKSVEKLSTSTTRVLLANGSHLAVDEVRIDDNEIVIELRRQPDLTLPLNQVKAIRFRKSSAATDSVWLGLLDTPSRGDRMVIRRSNDRLDPTDGIINGIADGKVEFDLDGDIISAPVNRLEGIIFGGNKPVAEQSNITITDTYGSTWAVSELLPSKLNQSDADNPDDRQGLRLQMNGKFQHNLPIDLVWMVRWSSGLFMLGDAKPAEQSVKTEFAINWKDNAADKWFGPQRLAMKKSSSSPPDQDLVLYGGSEVQYRVEDGFRLLTGSVRRDSEIKNAGGVTVRIKMDNKVVWENDLPNADSLGFELELNKARRIKFEIDSGDDGDLGAIVRLVRPRFVK